MSVYFLKTDFQPNHFLFRFNSQINIFIISIIMNYQELKNKDLRFGNLSEGEIHSKL